MAVWWITRNRIAKSQTKSCRTDRLIHPSVQFFWFFYDVALLSSSSFSCLLLLWFLLHDWPIRSGKFLSKMKSSLLIGWFLKIWQDFVLPRSLHIVNRNIDREDFLKFSSVELWNQNWNHWCDGGSWVGRRSGC